MKNALSWFKKALFLSLSGILCLGTPSALAQDEDLSGMQNDLDKITQYFQNMGMYFGYDLTGFCTTGGSCGPQGGTGFSNQLTSASSAYAAEIDLITSFLGALLPSVPPKSGGNTQPNFQLVPSTTNTLSTYAAMINYLGNQTYTAQSNGYTNPGSGSFSVSPIIDQQPYQNDPVNQSLLNILSTPDISYCVNSSTGGLYPSPPGCYTGATTTASGSLTNNPSLGGGPVLSQVQVMLNTIGAFPSGQNVGSSYPATGFFPLPSQNAAIVSQLNSDSLLGPLMFDNTGTQNTNSGSETQNNANSQGLTANNQIEQAANYIRYATGSVVPVTQPNLSVYGNLYAQATNVTGNITPASQLAAQSTIANYLASLRVYAAQTSVGISNLYYILSRRMPQKSYAASGHQTSQALSEYIMATWRLQPPTQSQGQTNTQTWTTQINNASQATVQKEIAILLAEINYQLYLTRVMQERMLLTNSTMLLQASRNVQPDSSLNKIPGAETESSSGDDSNSDSSSSTS